VIRQIPNTRNDEQKNKIMKKLTYLILLAIIIPATAISQPCLPDGITFSTQEEIDSFQTDYPNCTEIQGDVTISGVYINNLNGLSVLTSLGGTLRIYYNDALTSFSGLANLTSIGGELSIMDNAALTGLTGLDNLTSIGGSLQIESNPALPSLTGLDNVTSIGGGLDIRSNDALTGLTGLDNLTSIGGSLQIESNPALTNLAGLENITFINEGIGIHDNVTLTALSGLENIESIAGLSINSNPALTNLAGLENITSIGGELSIRDNTALTGLTGLDNVTSIGGRLYVKDNAALTSLSGLNNVTSIGGSLWIIDNTALTSLTGLDNVTSIGGRLYVEDNAALTSLMGLDNLDASSISDLYIVNNNLLSACETQSICNYLANPSGTVNIYNNATGCNNPPEIASGCGITLPCLPYGNYYFFTQDDIDNFQINYPGCTEIEGNVEINGDDITSLTGLNNLTSIGGNLAIGDYWNGGNPLLGSLSGLGNVIYIGGDLYIGYNDSLKSLTGLENVTSIGGWLWIYDNTALTSLTGLDNVTSIGGRLYVKDNAALTSLTGLDNIDAGSISEIIIKENPVLSICDVKSICDYLSAPTGEIDIYKNAPGCDNQGEVQDACAVCLPEGISFSSQEQIDSFQINYPHCTEIEGDVEISGNDITDLSGLNVITSIGGDFYINYNDSLTILLGLESLTSIGGDLYINYNNSLTSLMGLENMTSIGGTLSVAANTSITSLWGLENIYFGSIIDMYIVDNTVLSECEIQSVCEYLANPGGTIEISNNAPGCNDQQEVEDYCASQCLYDGIIFSTQAQIDSFQFNYPMCTQIEGNVEISGGSDICNLNGLDTLISIGGNLLISNNDSLNSLTGLESLITIDGSIKIGDRWEQGNSSLTSLAGLDNLYVVNGDLSIINNANLTSLDGLGNLTSVEGNLFIGDFWWGGNPSLTSLNGLEKLATVGADLLILDNGSLSDLSGLDRLGNVGQDLRIGTLWTSYGAPQCGANDSLEKIEGLNSLVSIGGTLEINCNSSLVEIAGFESLEYIGRDVLIGHFRYYGSPNNSFGGNPNLERVTGFSKLDSIHESLVIESNHELTDLSGFNNILTIDGNLSIKKCYSLANLKGLENLTTIKKDLILGSSVGHIYGGMHCQPNPSLASLADLSNLESIGGNLEIRCNDTLTTLAGLDNITTLGGYLHIGQNRNLTELKGLNNLVSVNDGLTIENNEAIASLSALSNLTTVGSGNALSIFSNPALSRLTGLDQIDPLSITNLQIFNNESLSFCHVKSVCDYLASPTGEVIIHDNAGGCDSINEVEKSCEASSVEEILLSSRLRANPNPFCSSTTLEFESTQPGKVEIKIYNQLGKLIEVIQKSAQPGKQVFTWDAGGLPTGIYFIRLQAGCVISTQKIVKL